MPEHRARGPLEAHARGQFKDSPCSHAAESSMIPECRGWDSNP